MGKPDFTNYFDLVWRCAMGKIILLVVKMGVMLVIPVLCIVFKAQAASFDCGNAKSAVEKMICADAELSKLDEELAKAYLTMLGNWNNTDEPVELLNERWLKERNRCTEVSCIKSAYERQLQKIALSTDFPPSESSAPGEKPFYIHCVDGDDPLSCGLEQSGKGYTVCEKYLNYLNSLQEIPKCEVPVPPGFRRPDWQEVDVKEHIDWAYQAEMIAIGRFGWKENQNADVWREKFVADMQRGDIVPSMRTVRIKPVGGEEITVLAYTRDRTGCEQVVQQKSKGTHWSDVGYAHFVLLDGPDAKLVEMPGTVGSMLFQTEMLLYNDRPYFIEEFSSATKDNPNIGILSMKMDSSPSTTERYRVKEFCKFDAFEETKK